MDHCRGVSHGSSRLWVRFAVDSVGTHSVDSAVTNDSAAATTLVGSGPYGHLRTDVRGRRRLRAGSEGAQNQNLRRESRLPELRWVDRQFPRRVEWGDVPQPTPHLDRGHTWSVGKYCLVGPRPSDNVILEEPTRGTYLMIFGADGMAPVQPTELSMISARFTGHLNYCAGTPNQCAFDAMFQNTCKSENSRWTMTRR